jgi:hypothetical protein
VILPQNEASSMQDGGPARHDAGRSTNGADDIRDYLDQRKNCDPCSSKARCSSASATQSVRGLDESQDCTRLCAAMGCLWPRRVGLEHDVDRGGNRRQAQPRAAAVFKLSAPSTWNSKPLWCSEEGSSSFNPSHQTHVSFRSPGSASRPASQRFPRASGAACPMPCGTRCHDTFYKLAEAPSTSREN